MLKWLNECRTNGWMNAVRFVAARFSIFCCFFICHYKINLVEQVLDAIGIWRIFINSTIEQRLSCVFLIAALCQTVAGLWEIYGWWNDFENRFKYVGLLRLFLPRFQLPRFTVLIGLKLYAYPTVSWICIHLHFTGHHFPSINDPFILIHFQFHPHN